jgi:hypothetical protein
MSKRESREASSTTPTFRIKLNADGTSNLDAAMLQDIHDYMSKLYPLTGVGTKTGVWRNIEREKPKLDESFIRALSVSSSAPTSKQEAKAGSGRSSKLERKEQRRSQHDADDEETEPSLADMLSPSISSQSVQPSQGIERLQYDLAVEVYKKKLIKYEVDIRPKYVEEVIQMFAVYHSFLDSNCKSKLDELEPQGYKDIVEERNGEKL